MTQREQSNLEIDIIGFKKEIKKLKKEKKWLLAFAAGAGNIYPEHISELMEKALS